MADGVRVRIAPSPTGAMHLGLARTALYNWLFCRHHGGSFVLRIDDTDQERNRAEALRPILDGLRWLGIDWDEGPEVGGPHEPYFQSERTQRYQEAVDRLLHSGHAYRDYATPEEIEAERRQAIESKQGVFRYSRRWMAEGPGERHKYEAEGRRAVVRLKMPSAGRLDLDDMVRGRVSFDWEREQDHVIQRQDGSVLYHLASAVDDAEMGISHIIRAEEHLSNTPRQVFILGALGRPLPTFAHLPYVAEPGSRNKLSKRKLRQYLGNRDFAELVERGTKVAAALGLDAGGDEFNPVTVEYYRSVGFLPGALVNYLVLLGWALDDRSEHFTRDELVRVFSLDRVNRAPASFDPRKLTAFQVRHFLALPREEAVRLTLPFLERAGLVGRPAGPEVERRLAAVLAAAGDRIKVAGDVLDFGDFFVPDDRLEFEPAAFEKRLAAPGAAGLLGRFRDRLAAVEPFAPAELEAALERFTADEGVKVGAVIHALRVAVTGKPVGFGMFETMAILGRESCLARIGRALARADGG
ncbi:MAG: glutamate--tRNA ligase [bacterium]